MLLVNNFDLLHSHGIWFAGVKGQAQKVSFQGPAALKPP